MKGYVTTRTPNDFGGVGWYEILPPPAPAQELEGDVLCEWAIVGGGFAGLAAARRLAQLRGKDRIVLIDAQRAGWGASGRNSGFMIDLPHKMNSPAYGGEYDADRKEMCLNRAAMTFAREAVEEYGLWDFFSPCGKYHGAADANGLKALKTFSAHLDALGEPYTWLDGQDMHRVTGTEYYVSGIHTPGTVIIQPAGYVRGVADGLRSKISIYENSPVIRIETGREHVIHTRKGTITAPHLIIATNGHAESLGFYRRRFVHVFTYASMTRRLTTGEQDRLGGEPEWALVPADPMGSTVRRLRDGRLFIRNTYDYSPRMVTSERQIARAGKLHDASFGRRFPMLEGIEMEYRWAGHYCLSLNAVPAFGEIDDRVYSACCCNGLGSVKGTLAGMLVAEMATEFRNPLIADMLAYDQPRKLYPEPLMSAAVKATIWWRERRAGRDL